MAKMERLQALGWIVPNDSKSNFPCDWDANDDDKRHLIAQIVLHTFAEVYEIPENHPFAVELCLE